MVLTATSQSLSSLTEMWRPRWSRYLSRKEPLGRRNLRPTRLVTCESGARGETSRGTVWPWKVQVRRASAVVPPMITSRSPPPREDREEDGEGGGCVSGESGCCG